MGKPIIMMISFEAVCRTLTVLWSLRVRGKIGYITERSKHRLASWVASEIFIGISRKIFAV